MNKICTIIRYVQYIYETKSINISAVCSSQSCLTVYHLFFLLPFASFSASLSVFLSNSFSATQFTFPCVCFSNAFLSASFSTSFLAYLSAFLSDSLTFSVFSFCCSIKFSVYCEAYLSALSASLSFSVFSFCCSIQFSVYFFFASLSVFLCTSCSAFLFIFLPASFLLLLKG